MRFINKENTLQLDAVIGINLYFGRILFEFLDIYHHDLSFTLRIFCQIRAPYIWHQFIPAVCSSDRQSSCHKFILGLLHQVKAVNNEIKFYSCILCRIKISQTAYGIICQGCFPTALCMPDNTALDTIIQFLSNGQWSKKLLITHYMLFQLCSLTAVFQFNLSVHIGKTISQ